MNQMTIRGFDKELVRRIRKMAGEKGVSLNKAALMLIRNGAGLTQPEEKTNVVGDSLDPLFGRWTEADEKEFLKAVRMFEDIDEQLWK